MNQNMIFCVQKIFEICFLKSFFSSKSCFLNNFFFKITLFKNIFFLQNRALQKYFSLQILTRRKVVISKSDASEIFNSKLTSQNFSPKFDFYLVFQVLTEWWYLLSTLIPTYSKEENSKTMRVIFSRQMYNWNLPHVNSSLNVWGIAIWHHPFFTVVTDRTLWSIKCSKSLVFLIIHFCENKRKRCLVRIPSIFSNVFVWATRRRAMERSWHLHSIYSILVAGRYLSQSSH